MTWYLLEILKISFHDSLGYMDKDDDFILVLAYTLLNSVRDHSFSTYAKFLEKATFLTPVRTE